MARTKSTARRTGKGPELARKAAGASQKRRKQGKPQHILKRSRVRRFSQNVRILSEIRRAQKCVELCTPKLSFRRVVRSICEDWHLVVRWRLTALLALQEAAEDFLIEYFNDMCVLAAHTHRVTVMDKDSNTLKRLRWRYDKLLHPTDILDTKMREILMIPSYQKSNDAVKVVDVTHDVNTRLRAENEARMQAEQEATKMEDSQRLTKQQHKKSYIEESAEIDNQNIEYLRSLQSVLSVVIPLEDGERQLTLDKSDIATLMDREAHISDSIIYVALKYVLLIKL